ncbi:MAG: ribonuclease HII [Nanoarchaeota archaeon]
MTKILGIDEAGRGPAIGPMIIAGVMINEGDENLLVGSKDSKMLVHKVRMILDKKIKENSTYKIIEVNPKEIDDALNSKKNNLNWLEAQKQAEIINSLNPDKAVIDCPSVNIISFKNYLRNLLNNKEIELIVEHKADQNYITCSAASILAKVRREEKINEIKNEYGDIGSGYPSDPKTKEFIKNNYSNRPEIFRHSWATLKKLSENQKKFPKNRHLCL